MLIILLESANKNLLLGYMPESLGLFIFGIILIVFAIGLRWFFNRGANEGNEKNFK